MAQNRLFYACQAVGLGDHGTAKYVEGVQSVGINTTIDFEQAFELGVITLYDNMEGTPSVELTLERNLVSGVHPLWMSMATLASEQANPPYTLNDHEQLVSVGSARPTAVLQVYKETTSYAGSTDNSSTATFYIELSGLYVTNYSVNVGLEGSPTESMSFVGNDYKWIQSGTSRINNPPVNGSSVASSGVIFRKQDLRTEKTAVGIVPVSGCVGGSGLQSVSFSMEFGREDIFELGRKTPYFKSATFPIEVTAELEFIDTGTQESNYLSAYDTSGYGFKAGSNADITKPLPIALVYGSGDLVLYMGSGRLTGTSRSGGDASGGNATISYSFQNFNYFHAKGNGYKHYSKLGSTTSAK